MNHDVNDDFYLEPAQAIANSNYTETNKDEEPPATIISRIRSLFSQTPEYNEIDCSDHPPIPIPANVPYQLSDQALLNIRNQAEYPSPDFLDMPSTITSAHRFSDVKRILTNFTIPTRQLPATATTHYHSRIESDGSSVYSSITGSGQSVISQTHSTSSVSTMANTPPLTPDSLSPTSSEGPAQFQYQYQDSHHQQSQPGIHINEEDHTYHNGHLSHSDDIKEGKKPQRPICYDALIADITDEAPPLQQQEALCDDTRDEWYGLEYTLELSRRDRRGSNSRDQTSAGEHSKSRESWAVIHQGTVQPFLEDEEYYHWKRWHSYLDKQDEKRKMQKAWAFMVQSEDFAHCYVEEMRTRDWIRSEQEQFGSRPNISYAKEHLYILAEHRPDPYFPPMKHGLAWHLKRSRSVGCLRELSPIPVLDEDDGLLQLNRIEEMDED